jgi:phosphocarrier protein
MKTQKVTVINQAGLRSSRIVSILNAKANEFKSQATIRIEDRVINAKSQLGVLSGGISYGTTITLTTSGEDEEEAMNALVKLFQSGFEDY